MENRLLQLLFKDECILQNSGSRPINRTLPSAVVTRRDPKLLQESSFMLTYLESFVTAFGIYSVALAVHVRSYSDALAVEMGLLPFFFFRDSVSFTGFVPVFGF